MNYLASLDSSRDLQFVCAKSFVNIFYLVLQISKIPTQKNFTLELNTTLLSFPLQEYTRLVPKQRAIKEENVAHACLIWGQRATGWIIREAAPS